MTRGEAQAPRPFWPNAFHTEEGDHVMVPTAALEWLAAGEVGASSRSLWLFMVGATERHPSVPFDADDFRRCELLIQAVPQWRARLPDLAEGIPRWALIVEAWDEIAAALKPRDGEDRRTAYSRARAVFYRARWPGGASC